MDYRTVGVLGGGQLGRMMAAAGHRIGVKLAILDPGGSASPAGQLSELSIEGSFTNAHKIKELSAVCDVITAEIEHVDWEALQELEESGHTVEPHPSTFRIIQNKYQQKVHLQSHGIALPDFKEVRSVDDCIDVGYSYGYPFVLKNALLAYDGKGNIVVKSADDIEECFDLLGKELYAERFVPFVKELAVMVVRCKSMESDDDDIFCYPVVETVQDNSICDVVMYPAAVSCAVAEAAEALARQAVGTLKGRGIFGVEMFLLQDGTVLLNEIAPRPHNSGHYTIESCSVDQFEMHIRAVLGLPCPRPVMRVPCAMMVNIIGKQSEEETMKVFRNSMSVSGVGVHWYGKNLCRKGRKMGHVTITANSESEMVSIADAIGVDRSRHGILVADSAQPRVGIIMGSDSDLPTMVQAAEILEKLEIPYELTIISAHRTPNRMYSYAQSAAERGLQVIIAGAGGAAHLPGMVAALTPLPVVGVPIKTSTLNGNDSLLSIVQMPKGVPVATVAIGNAANAGLLAARIIGAQDSAIRVKVDDHLNNQEEEVLQKAVKLEAIGHVRYLQDEMRPKI